jgi:hypothetical protein
MLCLFSAASQHVDMQLSRHQKQSRLSKHLREAVWCDDWLFLDKMRLILQKLVSITLVQGGTVQVYNRTSRRDADCSYGVILYVLYWPQ